MKFIGYATWDKDNETIHLGPQIVKSGDHTWFEVYESDDIDQYEPLLHQIKNVFDEDNQCIKQVLVEAPALAQSQDVNESYKEQAQLPIDTSFGLIDFDAESQRLIENLIDTWDALNLNSVDWKLHDNSFISLTKNDLVNLYTEAKVNYTQRNLKLFSEAQVFKNTPTTTFQQLMQWQPTKS